MKCRKKLIKKGIRMHFTFTGFQTSMPLLSLWSPPAIKTKSSSLFLPLLPTAQALFHRFPLNRSLRLEYLVVVQSRVTMPCLSVLPPRIAVKVSLSWKYLNRWCHTAQGVRRDLDNLLFLTEGSSIYDVTQFWTPLSPHRHAFYYKVLSSQNHLSLPLTPCVIYGRPLIC